MNNSTLPNNLLKEFYDKALLAFEKKNYEYAIELFSQILSSDYTHIEARHYLHLSRRYMQNTAKDAQNSSLFSKLFCQLNRFFTMISIKAMIKKGNIEGCLERLEKSLAYNPIDTELLKKIADIFYENGMIPQAIQNLEEAKSINPNDITILKKLGAMYSKKNDLQNARANYELVLKLDPKDIESSRAIKDLEALGTIQREFTQ